MLLQKPLFFDTYHCGNHGIPCILALLAEQAELLQKGPGPWGGGYQVPQTPQGASEPTDLTGAYFWRLSWLAQDLASKEMIISLLTRIWQVKESSFSYLRDPGK